MPQVEVSLPAAGIPDALSYELPESWWADNLVGRRAKVFLRNRPVIGVITRADLQLGLHLKPLKSVEAVLDESPQISLEQLALCRFIADYYKAPLGEVLRLCLPPGTPRTFNKTALPKKRKSKAAPKDLNFEAKAILLNAEQTEALSQISAAEAHQVFLLEGITGSGKTEVYIQAAEHVLSQGKNVLVIVPEIALTPQLEARFASQLSEPLITLHSGLKNSQRQAAFEDLLNQKIRVVLGTRSALFAPLSNLGLIVVDEEHDPSYKQDDSPRYHARDVALWRARHKQALAILGSATPSLESRLQAENGKYTHLKLRNRASQNSVLPQIELIDLKSRGQHENTQKKDRSQSEGQNLCILSSPLREAMADTLSRGEQVLLFLNRRGYASITLCDACGKPVHCPSCSVSLTFHQQLQTYRCHQCQYTAPFSLHCPSCHQGPILRLGVGTERIQKEVELFFPGVQIARLDRDSANTSAKQKQILEDMHSQKAQILIGTQMTAKGHDFENLSLVGVVLADLGLSMPDFRASERTFQLLTQVAGRAGRRERPGRVIIQTFNPGHPALVCLKTHDLETFSKQDAKTRKEAQQPPYVRAALLGIESEDQNSAELAARQVFECLQAEINHRVLSSKSSLLGPAKAPLEKLRNYFRWQVYLRAQNHLIRSQILQGLSGLKIKKARLIIDVDPVQLL